MPQGYPGTYKTYNCLFCSEVNKWGNSKTNKFCDNICQQKFRWLNETIPRIEQGEVPAGSPALRRYLVETHGEVCKICKTGTIWNKKPLVLQVDHIDGDSDNNYPKNLRLLCPNCHAQTETFGNGGKGSRYKKNTKRNSYLREYKASVV